MVCENVEVSRRNACADIQSVWQGKIAENPGVNWGSGHRHRASGLRQAGPRKRQLPGDSISFAKCEVAHSPERRVGALLRLVMSLFQVSLMEQHRKGTRKSAHDRIC
ncbi:hypothetical protein, partial [Mesorhizobium sp. M4B.F.Ca.ET.089.01.1.1]|uniref:hypothetical protein n=1 Tax=Mesorhizobium sp. M4B.F.Ca.ET.089.01.1.1 TaxID=2496662 RepID=UPI001AEC9343